MFSAHHLLLRIARRALEAGKEKKDGWVYQHLIAITFSALALEAFANACGERLLPRWRAYERASPLRKLRAIAANLAIGVPDLSVEPWSGARWLVSFRNQVVHAKPEVLKVDNVVSRSDYEKACMEYPESELESKFNEANAARAVQVVDEVLTLLSKRIPKEKRMGLVVDGFIGSGKVLHES